MQQGTCRLCSQEALLVNSHIFNEALYPPLYDEHHRALVNSATGPRPVRYIQKGLREHLLCESCDNEFLARLEGRGDALLAAVRERDAAPGEVVRLSEFNYAEFKLYALSLLWRAAICSRPEFAEVDLGPHEQRVREMLRGSDPGPSHEFGFAVIAFPEVEAAQALIYAPEQVRIHGHRSWRFMAGGLLWLIVDSGHSRELVGRVPFIAPGEHVSVYYSRKSHEELIEWIASAPAFRRRADA